MKEIKFFFETNKRELETFYPGITLQRLEQELTLISPDKISNFYQGLKAGIPLQYISGIAYFYKSEFFVNQAVLIPRPETELLVERALNFLKKNYHAVYGIDVGTGSGAIALSILRDLQRPFEMWATDISEEALLVAKQNGKEEKISFLKTDRLFNIDQKFDLIVSNPPYIKEKEDEESVHLQVKLYEPKLALYLPDDQYDGWFRTLFSQVAQKLNPRGLFLMEGHEEHLQNLLIIANESGLKGCKVLKDLTGRDRFLEATI